MMAVGSVIIRVGLAVDWRLTWVILASSGIVSGVLGGYLVESADHGVACLLSAKTRHFNRGPTSRSSGAGIDGGHPLSNPEGV